MNYYYRVYARGKKGTQPVASYIARTQPMVVREVFPARQKDGSVQISWGKSSSPNIVGYNIYRIEAGQMNFWEKPFTLREESVVKGEWVKLNKEPVKETVYIDNLSAEKGMADESRWPTLYLYRIHGVNVLDAESGPSPVSYSIPSWPGPVLVVQQEDGTRMVIAKKRGKTAVRGYHLYRKDTYKGDLIFRTHVAPRLGSVFMEDQTWPRGDRMAYFVIARDGLGQMGVPSSLTWARNMP
jgi:hypothetical protein